MIEGTLEIHCPPMAVRPTTQNPFRPFAPRITDNLPCSAVMTICDWTWEFVLTFPQTIVRMNWMGERLTLPDGSFVVPDLIVDPVAAWGPLGTNPNDPAVWIKYEQEASVFDAERLIHALPVDGVGMARLPDGRTAQIMSQLPEVIGDPSGRWWQWRKPWTMRAVTFMSRVVLL